MDTSRSRNLAPAELARLKGRLAWRLNRLRCMTPLEVGHRAARALRGLAESAGLFAAGTAPRPDFEARAEPWLRVPSDVDPRPYIEAAGHIDAGRLPVFALEAADLGCPPRWNRDPKSGITAPLSFGKHLDYRDPALVGDIKYLWEPNRHLHLVTLAQAWALSRDPRWLRALREQLESWIAACPYRYGPNWSSALEAALRLISWSAAWQLVGGAESPLFEGLRGVRLRALWLQSVWQHVHFVRGWPSRHSSANNHLIGEAAGVFVAALTWPYWRESRRWLAGAKKVLECEVLAQNAHDGVNREQAVAYQQFVLELLLACLLAGKANGQWFSPAYESRLEAMLDFLASIMDAGGHVPMFGDADDGRALRLSPDPAASPARALLGAGAILFRRDDFKLKAGAVDDALRWLFADADEAFAALDARKTRLPVRQAFAEGGYFVLGHEFDGPNEIRLVVDAGPLGYRSIAAHGHADALSFTLSLGGRELLVDPGTYAYHTQQPWRRYFRGTGAHNTVRIDGEDQSVQGGNFMWLRKARARCTAWSSSAERDLFEGWHDGYARLADPVVHRRTIALDKASRRISIEDHLEMRGEHEVELFFHCSERCTVEADAQGLVIARDGQRLRLRLPQAEGANVRVHRGELSPILGWVSPRFDVKLSAPTVAWRARLSGRQRLRSELDCGA